jgi:protein-glutamine gamma-glutamyltransferase
VAQVMATAATGIDWLEYIWNNYVMEMDGSRQRQAIYRPVINWIKETWGCLTSADWWKQIGRAVLHRLDPRNWSVEKWFSWRGGLVAVIVCFAWVGGWRLGRFLVRRLRKWIAARRLHRARVARVNVDFYRRLQAALGRRGMYRGASQTQREFARAVSGRLAVEAGAGALVPLVEWITDAFYRVRFGDHPLDKEDRQAVERALTQLEKTLESR